MGQRRSWRLCRDLVVTSWLDDEMAALREAGIDVVVSMLEEHEAVWLGLREEGMRLRSGLG